MVEMLSDVVGLMLESNMNVSTFGDDFIEFSGISKDIMGNRISVEGSLEVDDAELAYSVVYSIGYKDTDGIIGTYRVDTKAVSDIVTDLLVPAFNVKLCVG